MSLLAATVFRSADSSAARPPRNRHPSKERIPCPNRRRPRRCARTRAICEGASCSAISGSGPGFRARDRSIVTVAALIARDQIGRTAVLSRPRARQRREAGRDSRKSSRTWRSTPAGRTRWMRSRRRRTSSRAATSAPISSRRAPGPSYRSTRRRRGSGRRASESSSGKITPSLVQYTTDVLFRDLWLRPALAPRDRSLITVSALIATGQVAQITYHLNRAMDNGLTQGGGRRGARPSRVLCGLAKRVLGSAGHQGSHREAARW